MRYLFLLSVFWLFSCFQQSEDSSASQVALAQQEFQDPLWRSGKAELNAYTFRRLRYNEYREADVVMLFVSEPFSKTKQVKMDDYTSDPANYVEVVKMNYSEKFQTGVYPYSIFQSAFTELYSKKQLCLKTTTSVQEWCGHVFSQLNRKGKGYSGRLYSYFESEGDQSLKLQAGVIEEELFTKIRMGAALPVGDITAVPNAIYCRLYHKPYKPYAAKAALKKISLSRNEKTVERMKYSLFIEELNRELAIYFTTTQPTQITSWQEVDKKQEVVICEGKLKKQLLLDYWNKNAVKDSVYLDSLGL